jgi:hypothetical protein
MRQQQVALWATFFLLPGCQRSLRHDVVGNYNLTRNTREELRKLTGSLPENGEFYLELKADGSCYLAPVIGGCTWHRRGSEIRVTPLTELPDSIKKISRYTMIGKDVVMEVRGSYLVLRSGRGPRQFEFVYERE